jgi:tRNA U34 5-methylaminomethyl-2-thiouridine-forming methyltransferase MnmC
VPEVGNKFIDLHKSDWEKDIKISEYFTLKKIENDFLDTKFQKDINLVFYDAFSPDTQPELWTKDLFLKIYNCMSSNSILTTYSSKGIVKQALRDAGFLVKRLEGPIGKHHILNAIKTENQ